MGPDQPDRAPGTALDRARELAALLCRRPATGLAAVKALVDAAADQPEEELVRRSLDWSEQAFTSADGAEGVAAFLAKRPARFRDARRDRVHRI